MVVLPSALAGFEPVARPTVRRKLSPKPGLSYRVALGGGPRHVSPRAAGAPRNRGRATVKDARLGRGCLRMWGCGDDDVGAAAFRDDEGCAGAGEARSYPSGVGAVSSEGVFASRKFKHRGAALAGIDGLRHAALGH